jgi:histidine triad (HIT) family protein
MPSIFSRIASGEIPCYKVAEDDHFLAFLDIGPLVKGHTLVIPKKETDYIFNLDDREYNELFLFAKKVALALGKVVPCKKIGIAVIGLEVRHAHIHLVPLDTGFEIDFSKPKLSLAKEEFQDLVDRISMEFLRTDQ